MKAVIRLDRRHRWEPTGEMVRNAAVYRCRVCNRTVNKADGAFGLLKFIYDAEEIANLFRDMEAPVLATHLGQYWLVPLHLDTPDTSV